MFLASFVVHVKVTFYGCHIKLLVFVEALQGGSVGV